MLGGFLWMAIPLVRLSSLSLLTSIVGLGAITGLSFGLLELWFEHVDDLGAVGRVGSLVIGAGFVARFVAFVLDGIYAETGMAALFVVGVPTVVGGLLIAIGSGLLGFAFHRHGTVPNWTVLLLSLGVPIDFLLTTIGGRMLPTTISLYGIAWIATGRKLHGARPSVVLDKPSDTSQNGIGSWDEATSLNVAFGGFSGFLLAAIGIAGILDQFEMIQIGAIPIVGKTLLMSSIHLTIGGIGIVTAWIGNRILRRYLFGAGISLLGIAVGWAVPPVRGALGLTLVGLVLPLSLGLLLLAAYIGTRRPPLEGDR